MLDIAIAFDQNLLHVAHVVVRSAIANSSVPLRIHALTRGIGVREFDAFVARATAGSPSTPVHCYQLDNQSWGDVKIGQWLSISTMDRIHLPNLLPHVDRCLYVDIDCVTLGDVADLLFVPHGPAGIAAKASTRPTFRTMVHYAKRAKIDWRKLEGMVGNNPRNFNAGVLWMSLDTLRQRGMTARASELVAATRCNDQIALVGYANDQFGELPARWNAWAPVDAHRPECQPFGILHFVGSKKPWNDCKCLHRKHWDQYA